MGGAEPSAPVFTVPGSVARGYQGQEFYVEYAVNNTSHNQIILANLTVTLDYGTFQPVTSRNNGYGEVFSFTSIPIPSSEPVGNHWFTAAASLIYRDNNTGNWVPFSNNPQTVTGTLIVLANPATSALDNIVLPILLPTAGLIALPGVVLGTRSIRRRRKVARDGNTKIASGPRSRFALFTLASTVAIIVSLLVVDLLVPFDPSTDPLLTGGNIIGFLLLLGFLGTLYTRSGYSLTRFRPLLLLSVSATIASAIRVQIVQAANPCSAGVVGGGYPLPWAPIFFPLASYPPFPVFLCPMLTINLAAWLAPIAFLLDTAFYFAVGLCTIELYKIIKWGRCKSSLAS